MKKKIQLFKRTISLLLCLALLMSYAPPMVSLANSGTTDTWDGTVADEAYESGAGSAADPYIIMTASQLAKLAENVNGGKTYDGVYFELGANLDLNGANYNWTPIGDENNAFSGIFDGNEKTISNLKCHSAENQAEGYKALFGYVIGNNESNSTEITQGIIKDIIFDNPNIYGTSDYIGTLVAKAEKATITGITVNNPTITGSNCQYAGGLIGYMDKGHITYCNVVGGTINLSTGSSDVGGIAGSVTGDFGTLIQHCSVKNATIGSVGNNYGGICGSRYYGDMNFCVVENCTITTSGSNVGGLIGDEYTGHATISMCSGAIGCEITGYDYAGGIIRFGTYFKNL